jgi:lysophospholipase L1-like esterase
MKKLLLLFLFAVIAITQVKVTATVPAGAIKASPNMIFYASSAPTFYDASGNVLMSYSGSSVLDNTGTVIYTSTSGAEYGWSATPALTAWATGVTSGTYFEYPNFLTANVPTYATSMLMRPFWSADTIYNETVLLTGAGKTAKLMYAPKQIISVKNFDGSVTLAQGTDYTIAGRTITQVGTKASATYSAAVGKNKLNDVNLKSWTNVTYIPDRTGWNATNIFVNRTSSLPKTTAKLNAKQPLVVEFFGMSITAGLNTSGFAGDASNFTPTAPYQHSYADLFGQQIQNIFGSKVTVINGSCGGKTAAWTDAMVKSMVTPNNPDLVFLDQGMNDIWGTTNAAFKASISSAISKIQTACPNAEIVLIGNMLPDSLGVGTPGTTGPSLMRGLSAQLKSLEQTGVVYYDFTQMCDTIYKRKGGASNCVSNGLHPNDFLARCYAQGLVQLFYNTPTLPTEAPSIAARSSEKFITVVPNPVVDGHFILSFNEEFAKDGITISIYDMHGRQVASMKQSDISKDYQASDLNMTSGIYIVKAFAGDKVSTTKVEIK